MVFDAICGDPSTAGPMYGHYWMKYRKAKRAHVSPYSPPTLNVERSGAAMVIQRVDADSPYGGSAYEKPTARDVVVDKNAPQSSSSGFCASSSSSPSSLSCHIMAAAAASTAQIFSPAAVPSTSRGYEEEEEPVAEIFEDRMADRYRPVHISPGCSPTRDVVSTASHSEAAILSPRHRDFSRSTPMRKNLIQKLIEIDRLDSLINLRGLKLRSAAQTAAESVSAAQRLSHIGDEIVEQLVEWTKTLPFYGELPVEVHTHLLTQRWAELVILSACFSAYCLNQQRGLQTTQQHNIPPREASASPYANLRLLQERLSAVMAKHIPFEHVSKEAGPLVTTFTELYDSFCQLRITLEAYVCLKVITILHYTPPVYENEEENAKSAKIHVLYARKVCAIQDQFVKALQIHLSQCEDGPRLSEILNWQPALRMAGTTLLQSKMFYVPFLICKAPDALPADDVPPTAAAVRNGGQFAVHNDDDDGENPANDETDCEDDDEPEPVQRPAVATTDS